MEKDLRGFIEGQIPSEDVEYYSESLLLEEVEILRSVQKTIATELITWADKNLDLREYAVEKGKVKLILERGMLEIIFNDNEVGFRFNGKPCLPGSKIFGAGFHKTEGVQEVQVDLSTPKTEILKVLKENSNG